MRRTSQPTFVLLTVSTLSERAHHADTARIGRSGHRTYPTELLAAAGGSSASRHALRGEELTLRTLEDSTAVQEVQRSAHERTSWAGLLACGDGPCIWHVQQSQAAAQARAGRHRHGYLGSPAHYDDCPSQRREQLLGRASVHLQAASVVCTRLAVSTVQPAGRQEGHARLQWRRRARPTLPRRRPPWGPD